MKENGYTGSSRGAFKNIEYLTLFFEKYFKRFSRFGIWLCIFEKIHCRFQYVNLCILAFHSHLTPLELCSSVRTKSHMDTHASGIKDQRK